MLNSTGKKRGSDSMKTNTSTTWLESLFTPSLIHLCSKSFCAKFYNKVGMRAKRTNEGGGGRREGETLANKSHNSKSCVCPQT